MGLVTNQKYPILTRKDIVVYKVLKKIKDNQYRVCPPAYQYNNTIYELGKIYETIDINPNQDYHSIEHKKKGDILTIGKDFFHTFTDLKMAKLFLDHVDKKYNESKGDLKVLKSIIPKGTYYYKGTYQIFGESYASNKIKYLFEI